jgi:hypothetical protein
MTVNVVGAVRGQPKGRMRCAAGYSALPFSLACGGMPMAW